MPPLTPITSEIWCGSATRPMSISGSRLATWPASKHSCSGLIPSSRIAVEELDDRVEGVLEHRLEDEVLAPARVLRVVHRAHVQRRDVGLQLAQVLEPLLDRDADRAGRVVDDHVADLVQDRLGDRAEVLDLVARGAVGGAGVDVDLRGALVDRAPRLGRVLLRRVGDRRALVAVRDRARDRAADDHRVVEAAHTGITPCLRQGLSTFLSFAIRSAADDRRAGLARVDDVVDHRVAAPRCRRRSARGPRSASPRGSPPGRRRPRSPSGR